MGKISKTKQNKTKNSEKVIKKQEKRKRKRRKFDLCVTGKKSQASHLVDRKMKKKRKMK